MFPLFDDRLRHGIGVTNLAKTFAIVACVAAVNENGAEAADLTFDSGTISSNNVVGWQNGVLVNNSYAFSVTGSRQFFAKTNALAGNDLGFVRGALAAATFKVGTYTGNRDVSFPLQLFNYSQTFGEANDSNTIGLVGFLSNGNVYGSINPERQAYLLFRFEDNSTVYNGWIDVNIRAAMDGEEEENFIIVNRYAWQSSTLGVLRAGVTPVPEPSTVVTSGIAALAGGAVALRRWRKERKAKAESA